MHKHPETVRYPRCVRIELGRLPPTNRKHQLKLQWLESSLPGEESGAPFNAFYGFRSLQGFELVVECTARNSDQAYLGEERESVTGLRVSEVQPQDGPKSKLKKGVGRAHQTS